VRKPPEKRWPKKQRKSKKAEPVARANGAVCNVRHKFMIRLLAFYALLFALLTSFASAGMRMSLFVLSADEARALTPARIVALLEETSDSRVLDIDKAWHGIHYLLAGSGEPTRDVRSLAIFGGKEVGDDLGYGPARLLSPADVKEVARVLKEESLEKLSARYDPKKMEKLQIYPEIWVREGKEAFEYLAEYYRKLAAFYENAAASGSALLLVIS
jgi:hypothetical protein